MTLAPRAEASETGAAMQSTISPKLARSYVHGVSPENRCSPHRRASCSTGPPRAFAGRPALVVRHEGLRWSYAELRREVDALAAGLIALGLAPGERIGIWAPNCAAWVVTQFATAKAGLILVNINPAYRLSELEYALNKVGCKALITAAKFKNSDYIAMLEEIAHRRFATRRQAGHAAGRAPARPAPGHPARCEPPPRHAELPQTSRPGGRGRAATAGRSRSPTAVRRPDQHPVHQRHHRRPQGGDPDPPQHRQQRLSFVGRDHGAERPRPDLHPRCPCTTVSVWSWAR